MTKKSKHPSALLRFFDKTAAMFIFLFSQKMTPWVIAGIFIANALWVALFYRFPLVYDEHFHFHAIQAFSNFLTPIVLDQPEEYDSLGSLTFGSASLYHYLLSFPYRLLTFFTDSLYIQIVSFRLLNILAAASSILIFYTFFKELGIKKHLVNIALLTFSLIPLTTNIAANINYDNAILPLTALLLLYAGRLLSLKKPDATLFVKILTVGTLASLIKFTFLPFFGILLIFLAASFIKDNTGLKKTWVVTRKYFEQTWTRKTTLWAVCFIILLFIAGFRYGVALVSYGTPIPNCTRLMEVDRCEQNLVFRITQDALNTKEARSTENPISYVYNWMNVMTGHHAKVGVNTPEKTDGGNSPILYATLLHATLSISILVLLYMWRSLKLDRRYTMAITCCVGLIATTLLFNIATYYSYNADLNVQPRYATATLPVILVFGIFALDTLLGKRRYIKLALLTSFLLLTLHGGGAITHIAASKDNWYWEKPKIEAIQREARKLVTPFVKEK